MEQIWTPSERKKVAYASEKLCLICEWEECDVVEVDIEIFLCHITKEHLTKLNADDLHCHWKDCEGFTETLPELRRHILLHGFHAKIKCYGANFQIRKNISNCLSSIQSRNIVPELPEPLICCWEDCMLEFESPEHFYRHVDSHAMYDCKKYGNPLCLWQDCKRTFVDTFKVKEHLRSHTQEKLVACPTCGGMFASRTKFYDHILRQQSSDGASDVYVCEYCPNKFNSERLLRDHTRHHVNHYKCPYCDMTCPTPSDLGAHISYRHSEEKPHSCEYCDFRCKNESDLRKHLESHSMVPTYKCPVENCTYAARSQTCYRAHYRKIHEGKSPLTYSCHLCEKVFSRGNYLTKHLLKKHKFRWPSGHCRFRYCLNEEGVYRLQTVRYESLELSQEMMGENSELIAQGDEDIDDPNVINISQKYIETGNQVSNNITITESQTLINNASTSIDMSNNSIVLNLEGGNNALNQEGMSIVCIPYVTENKTSVEQQPVLIKILEMPSAIDQSLLQSNSYYVQNCNLSGVQPVVQTVASPINHSLLQSSNHYVQDSEFSEVQSIMQDLVTPIEESDNNYFVNCNPP
ncbi:histone H4 transcription factor [Caerostris extrusa]|uniref:Histone H4 transcription factor n=1 Tax=Caerostris extrusa TaxID=172846 RepID=A0AAV4RLI5_CAEEX|nr:histone H4 transcription factor [Caerostris extrusa]